MIELDRDSDIGQLVYDSHGEGRAALDALVPRVYHELKRMARDRLRRERPDHTLSTTGLVHEAYLRLADGNRVEWHDRAHFLAMASRVMRSILVDYARRRTAEKRGGGRQRVDLDEALLVPDRYADRVLELHAALLRLDDISSRQHAILEQRYFGGLTLEETGEALGLSLTTIKRELRFAKAWLSMELGPEVGV